MSVLEQDPQSKHPTKEEEKEENVIGYRDFLNVSVEKVKEMVELPSSKRKGPRGGVAVPFPTQLFQMLEDTEKKGLDDIVSWQVHGRCFIVHQPLEFVDEILPRYFRQSKLTSFQRQLNFYGFVRLTSGKDRGAYYHELFLRGRPDLSKLLMRLRSSSSSSISVESRIMAEPDLWSYPFASGFAALNAEQQSQNQAQSSTNGEMKPISRVNRTVGSSQMQQQAPSGYYPSTNSMQRPVQQYNSRAGRLPLQKLPFPSKGASTNGSWSPWSFPTSDPLNSANYPYYENSCSSPGPAGYNPESQQSFQSNASSALHSAYNQVCLREYPTQAPTNHQDPATLYQPLPVIQSAFPCDDTEPIRIDSSDLLCNMEKLSSLLQREYYLDNDEDDPIADINIDDIF